MKKTILLVILAVITSVLLNTCKREDAGPKAPTITILTATEIQETSAIINGIVNGGGFLTTVHFEWGTNTSFGRVIEADQSPVSGSKDVNVSAYLSGLQSGTTYHYRIMASSAVDVVYSENAIFTTDMSIPQITTNPVTITSVIPFSIISGGNISDDGGSPVTARGMVLSTTEFPTIENNEGLTNDGIGSGSFFSAINNLPLGKTYYVRAYATNSIGTAYGGQVVMSTVAGTFSDSRDGQPYSWVKIGDQIWMVENLKYLPEVVGPETGSETTPYYYVYGYDGVDVSVAKTTDNFKNYGVLYNWPAAMAGASPSSNNPSGVKGVCPPGWHLPSEAEWMQLINFVEYQSHQSGNALKSCRQVNSPLGGGCNTSEHPRWESHSTHYGYDVFGFSALPGGHRLISGYYGIGNSGHWWSSFHLSFLMSYNLFFVSPDSFPKQSGISVRCIHDSD